MAVVMPSLRTETCLDLSDSAMTVTVEEIAAYVELGNTSPSLTFDIISPD